MNKIVIWHRNIMNNVGSWIRCHLWWPTKIYSCSDDNYFTLNLGLALCIDWSSEGEQVYMTKTLYQGMTRILLGVGDNYMDLDSTLSK